MHVAPPLQAYLVDLAEATRNHPAVAVGMSPRATLALCSGWPEPEPPPRAGRTSCPTTSRRWPGPVLSHRLLLSPEAQLQGLSAPDIVEDVLHSVRSRVPDRHDAPLRRSRACHPHCKRRATTIGRPDMVNRQGWVVVLASVGLLIAGRLLGLLELFLLGTAGLLPGRGRRSSSWPARDPAWPCNGCCTLRGCTQARRAGWSCRSATRARGGPACSGCTTRSPTPRAPSCCSVRSSRARSSRPPTSCRPIAGASCKAGPLRAVVTDPFGLAERSFPVADVAELTVLPRIDELTPMPHSVGRDDPHAGADHPNVLGQGGEDFYTLREYVDGRRPASCPLGIDRPAGRAHGPPGRGAVAGSGHRAARCAPRHDVTPSRSSSRCRRRRASSPRRSGIVTSPGSCITDGTDSGYVDGHAQVDQVMEQLAVVNRSRTVEPAPDPARAEARRRAARSSPSSPTRRDDDIDALLKLHGRFGVGHDRAVRAVELGSAPGARGRRRRARRRRPAAVGCASCASPPKPTSPTSGTRPSHGPRRGRIVARRTAGREPGRVTATGATIGRPAGGAAARRAPDCRPWSSPRWRSPCSPSPRSAGSAACTGTPRSSCRSPPSPSRAMRSPRPVGDGASPPPVVAVIAVVAGAVLIVWLFFGRTTVLGVPTPHTIDVADAALRHAWSPVRRRRRAGSGAARLPAGRGARPSGPAIWFADWAAFRALGVRRIARPGRRPLRVRLDARRTAPSRRVTTVLFAAAALGLHARPPHRPSGGRRDLDRHGTGCGSPIPASEPGVDARRDRARRRCDPRAPHARRGPQGRRALAAGVRSRTALGSPSAPWSTSASVSSTSPTRRRSTSGPTDPSYWRLTSLDTFDGRIWSSGGSFAQAGRVARRRTMPRVRGPRQITPGVRDQLAQRDLGACRVRGDLGRSGRHAGCDGTPTRRR